MMNRFWWLSDVGTNRGIRWMSWSNMCHPKKYGGMGFKRIHEFNLAMLGKQAWRVLAEPSSFIARLLKARYFPKCSFGEATLGNNPSYVWRSILAAQHLVVNGSVMKIGTGESVNVWRDPWLLETSHRRISTQVYPGLEETKVCNLMTSDRREWDIDIRRDLFNNEDIQHILKIPLSITRGEDTWLWLDDTKGTYTVKSAYRRVCQEYARDQLTGDIDWLKMWSLAVAPKVKNFLWRAMRSCIPTLLNLRQKKIEVYPICPICHDSLESVEHVLVTCMFAKRCWELVDLNVPCDDGQPFQQYMHQLLNHKTSKELEIIGSVMWQIWAHRNNVVWNKKWQTPSLAVNTAGSTLFQWQRAQMSQNHDYGLNEREGVLVW